MSKIKVGTFNIAAGLIPDTQAINRLITKYDLDIVGLQEVDLETERNPYDMLAKVAGTEYPHRYYADTMEWHGGGKYGLGIVSKHPILARESFKYSVTGEEDRIYQRVEFSIRGEDIIFFNTHLAFETQEIRRVQVKELLDAVKLTDKNIIVGDFNFSDTIHEWEAFTDFTLANPLNDLKDTFRYRDEDMVNFAIDNIIVSKALSLTAAEVSSTPLSDHALVVTEITI